MRFSGIMTSNKTLIENRVFDAEKGTKNSCTFQFICRECDSKAFSEYEDSSNIRQRPSNKMMAEIELKNTLQMLSKRRYEQPFYEIMESTVGNFNRGPYISYLVFAYTENFVMAPNIDRMILKNENLRVLAQEVNGVPNMGLVPAIFETSDYQPISWKKIPNLLDKKYAIR